VISEMANETAALLKHVQQTNTMTKNSCCNERSLKLRENNTNY